MTGLFFEGTTATRAGGGAQNVTLTSAPGINITSAAAAPQPPPYHTPLDAAAEVLLAIVTVSLLIWCCKPVIPDERYHYQEIQRRKRMAKMVPEQLRRKQVANSLECGRVVSHDAEGNPMLSAEVVDVMEGVEVVDGTDPVKAGDHTVEIEMADMSRVAAMTTPSAESPQRCCGENKEQGTPSTVPMSETYAEMDDNPNEDSSCVICLDTFDRGDVVCWAKHSACNHVFHRDCLLPWLHERQHDDCPNCREILVIKEETSKRESIARGALTIVHGLIAAAAPRLSQHSYAPVLQQTNSEDERERKSDDIDIEMQKAGSENEDTFEESTSEHEDPAALGESNSAAQGEADPALSPVPRRNSIDMSVSPMMRRASIDLTDKDLDDVEQGGVVDEALRYSITMSRTRSARRSSIQAMPATACFVDDEDEEDDILAPIPLARARSRLSVTSTMQQQ